MITLYQAPRAWRCANVSPFCIKLEAYLRMADIPYEVKAGDPRKAPKGKVPYVRHQGQLIGDSSEIIARLKRDLGDPLDARLTKEQHALGYLIQRTLEEGFYWVSVYGRWVPDASFEEMKRALFRSFMGPPLIWLVPDLVRKRVLGTLYSQGTTRHASEDIYAMGQRDMAAVETMLSDTPYLFGEEPTSYDAVIYAFSSAVWHSPFAAQHGACPPKVKALMERVHARYFSDIA